MTSRSASSPSPSLGVSICLSPDTAEPRTNSSPGPIDFLRRLASANDSKRAANDLTDQDHPNAGSDSHHSDRSATDTTDTTDTEPKPITRKGCTSVFKHSRGRIGRAALLMRDPYDPFHALDRPLHPSDTPSDAAPVCRVRVGPITG